MEFDEFVRARGDALHRYGYVLAGNPDDAADLVQEALIRLGDAWHRVRNKHDPEGYVRTIMARQHISRWRRSRREHLVDAVPEGSYRDQLPDPDLWDELATLPRKQRAVLVLRYYEDLSDNEIAATLGISPGTVRSQASRALAKLRVRRAEQAAVPSPMSTSPADMSPTSATATSTTPADTSPTSATPADTSPTSATPTSTTPSDTSSTSTTPGSTTPGRTTR